MTDKDFGSIATTTVMNDLKDLIGQVEAHPAVRLGAYLHNTYCSESGWPDSGGECDEGIDCDRKVWMDRAEELLLELSSIFPGVPSPIKSKTRKLQLDD